MNPRQRRRAKLTGWSRILFLGGVSGAVSTVVLAGLAGIVSGTEAALSAALGAAVALLLSAVSIAVAEIGDRFVPDLTIVLFLGAFVVKLFVLGVLLLFLPVPEWMDPMWAGTSAMIALLIWQIAAVVGFRSMRMPITGVR